MQAIARANRVNEGKNNGLIVDYCGILKSLRQALATFGGSTGGDDDGEADPVRPEEELLQDLSAAIGLVKDYLVEKGGHLKTVVTSSGFQRIATIESLKNLINENDETRKRFFELRSEQQPSSLTIESCAANEGAKVRSLVFQIFASIRSIATRRRTPKRDGHGVRFFLHQETRLLACVLRKTQIWSSKAGQYSRTVRRTILQAVRPPRRTDARSIPRHQT